MTRIHQKTHGKESGPGRVGGGYFSGTRPRRAARRSPLLLRWSTSLDQLEYDSRLVSSSRGLGRSFCLVLTKLTDPQHTGNDAHLSIPAGRSRTGRRSSSPCVDPSGVTALRGCSTESVVGPRSDQIDNSIATNETRRSLATSVRSARENRTLN